MASIVEAHEGPENQRYVLELSDGARVETVVYRGDSLCVSAQVGCSVGCPFCASGANGLARNLTCDELIGQVTAVRARHPTLARVTISGVGEPLHNLAAVAPFITWGQTEDLPVSLTTSGGPLRRLHECLAMPHRGLTISVHAGHEDTRARLVPKGPTLAALFDALDQVVAQSSRARRRKLALAYLLLEGINDSDEEVDAFLDRARPLDVKIQLYAHNAIPGDTQHRTEARRYRAVYERMRDVGVDIRRSSRARIQVNGGCGTLLAFPVPRSD